MTLREYNRKRKFDRTPEPVGRTARRQGELRFVVQMHRASRLHFDFRLEMGGAFKSWAVPRGPSLNPMDQRLAVFVEDHPIAYGSFEGIIPRGNYGAGTVMIWDYGTYLERGSSDARASEKAMLEGLAAGHMTFLLNGAKLKGEFALIRLKKGDDKTWLLVKKRDGFATFKIRELDPVSAATGRTLDEIAAQAEKKGEVWLPKRTASENPVQDISFSRAPLAAPAAPGARKAAPAARSRARPPARPAPKKSPRGTMPRRLLPMLARTARASGGELEREGWLYCELTGGLRALAEVDGKQVSLHSRKLLSFNRKFPGIVDALAAAGAKALLDGEIARDGSRFRVFDLLYLDGEDLRQEPLRKRLARLGKLPLFRKGGALELVPQLADDGRTISRKNPSATILARDASSPYRSGVDADWIELRGAGAPESATNAPAAFFTHLDKIYWKREGYTKQDLIDYYRQVAPAILPHLSDRPMSLHRFPDGADAKGFYQKDFSGYKPRFIRTHRVHSESSARSIDYVLCQNEETLLYLANLGCIEMNPWLSRVQSIDRPDFLVIDLDPDDHPYSDVVDVALATRKLLEKLEIESFCKTSGSRGMHVCVPLRARFEYELAREFAERVCRRISLDFPALTTLERNPAKRGGRMYLDFMQNRISQTLASAYSARPKPGATVSTPLRWSEVTRKLDPAAFTIRTLPRRLDRLGDLWAPLLERQNDVSRALGELRELESERKPAGPRRRS